MSDYKDTVRKHRRLAILRHLEACVDYTSNASILGDVLAGVGLPLSRDQLVTELTWLAEQGFVALGGTESFTVATATQAGADIARGRAQHPDIQRPSPRA